MTRDDAAKEQKRAQLRLLAKIKAFYLNLKAAVCSERTVIGNKQVVAETKQAERQHPIQAAHSGEYPEDEADVGEIEDFGGGPERHLQGRVSGCFHAGQQSNTGVHELSKAHQQYRDGLQKHLEQQQVGVELADPRGRQYGPVMRGNRGETSLWKF